jgi:hypothetical protein
MMRRFPPGERKINYTHIINGRNVFVKRNGSREKTYCEAPGGMREMKGTGGNLWHWTHFFLWYIGE